MNDPYANFPDHLHPAKNFTPRQNPKKTKVETPDNAISPETIATIDQMPASELRALVKRMACQCGLVANMSEEETAQAMLDTLAHTALKPIAAGLNMRADIQSRMAAIDKWLDRTRGKPVQSIKQDTTVSFDLQANTALLNRFAQKMGVKDTIVIENTTSSG